MRSYRESCVADYQANSICSWIRPPPDAFERYRHAIVVRLSPDAKARAVLSAQRMQPIVEAWGHNGVPGTSPVRTNKTARVSCSGPDHEINQLSELGFYLIATPSGLDAYNSNRATQDAAPTRGDGGVDYTQGELSVDVKARRFNAKSTYMHMVMVFPDNEKHEGHVYVHAVCSDYSVGVPHVVFLGYAYDHMLKIVEPHMAPFYDPAGPKKWYLAPWEMLPMRDLLVGHTCHFPYVFGLSRHGRIVPEGVWED